MPDDTSLITLISCMHGEHNIEDNRINKIVVPCAGSVNLTMILSNLLKAGNRAVCVLSCKKCKHPYKIEHEEKIKKVINQTKQILQFLNLSQNRVVWKKSEDFEINSQMINDLLVDDIEPIINKHNPSLSPCNEVHFYNYYLLEKIISTKDAISLNTNLIKFLNKSFDFKELLSPPQESSDIVVLIGEPLLWYLLTNDNSHLELIVKSCKILKNSGYKVHILDKEKLPGFASWIYNDIDTFANLARDNIKLIEQSPAQTFITLTQASEYTFKQLYRDNFEGRKKIVSIANFLNKNNIIPKPISDNIAFHPYMLMPDENYIPIVNVFQKAGIEINTIKHICCKTNDNSYNVVGENIRKTIKQCGGKTVIFESPHCLTNIKLHLNSWSEMPDFQPKYWLDILDPDQFLF